MAAVLEFPKPTSPHLLVAHLYTYTRVLVFFFITLNNRIGINTPAHLGTETNCAGGWGPRSFRFPVVQSNSYWILPLLGGQDHPPPHRLLLFFLLLLLLLLSILAPLPVDRMLWITFVISIQWNNRHWRDLFPLPVYRKLWITIKCFLRMYDEKQNSLATSVGLVTQKCKRSC